MSPHGWSYLMTIATCAFAAQWLGIFFRKNKKTHMTLMNLAILTDISLVLGLQIKRDAVGTVMADKLHGLQFLHVLFSTTATVLYIPMLVVGWSLYKNSKWILRERSVWVSRHRNLGFVTLTFRTLGWLMMWSLVN